MKILACKYHGWSYGIDGKLAKAPYFEDIADFNKSEHSLLPIHVHIDTLGFIWVNLEASEVPSMAWEDQFPDRQARFESFPFSEYSYHHSWSQDADCNWKNVS